MTTPGDSALAIGEAIVPQNIPYSSNPHPPQSFDCSSFVQWCYQHGPGIAIGRDTWAQWSTGPLQTVMDVTSGVSVIAGIGSGIPNSFNETDLQTGDLIYYFADNNSGNAAHVMMYAGGGQCVEAPSTGQVVKNTALPKDSSGKLTGISDPLRGVRRATGGGSSNASGPGQGSGSDSGSSTFGLSTSDYNNMVQQMNALKDPRSNLPFSASFQGQAMAGVGGGVGGNPGSLQVPAFGAAPTLYPATKLVRGGMGELVVKQFKCYFMMNPEQISISAGINVSQLSPFLQGPDLWKSGGYGVTNQTVTFTVYFNRMYEVWRGDVHSPVDGGPGPSDEGVRWDIRALERLMGVFDATTANGQDVGLGNNGWGGTPPSQLPLQIVFGGKNALRFQGQMASFDYTFTLFDSNMIPVEAYADIGVMRIYNPSGSSPELLSGPGQLWTTSVASGPQLLPPAANATFNTNLTT